MNASNLALQLVARTKMELCIISRGTNVMHEPSAPVLLDRLESTRLARQLNAAISDQIMRLNSIVPYEHAGLNE
jgi:hypothetical protein